MASLKDDPKVQALIAKAVAASKKESDKALKDEIKRIKSNLAGIEYPEGLTGKQKAAIKAGIKAAV